jgi:hypothetical protein
MRMLFERMRGGSFAVIYQDGATQRYGEDTPQCTIRIKDDSVRGVIGEDLLTSFGAAYMSGLVDVEGDLADLLSLALHSCPPHKSRKD